MKVIQPADIDVFGEADQGFARGIRKDLRDRNPAMIAARWISFVEFVVARRQTAYGSVPTETSPKCVASSDFNLQSNRGDAGCEYQVTGLAIGRGIGRLHPCSLVDSKLEWTRRSDALVILVG